MLYLIVATITRDIQFDRGFEEWADGSGQMVLGSLYANNYEDALEMGSEKYNVIVENIEAYLLAE